MARASVAESVTNIPLAFAAAQPTDLKDFDFMFPKLQHNPRTCCRRSRNPGQPRPLGQTMD